MATLSSSTHADRYAPDSGYAWWRLAVATLLSTISGAGMWSFVVALPTVQADFGVTRADASLAYTLMMIGFAVGSVGMGRVADRHGIALTITVGAVALGVGYVGAGIAPTLI